MKYHSKANDVVVTSSFQARVGLMSYSIAGETSVVGFSAGVDISRIASLVVRSLTSGAKQKTGGDSCIPSWAGTMRTIGLNIVESICNVPWCKFCARITYS